MPSDSGPPEVHVLPNNPLLKSIEPIAQKVFLSNFNFEKRCFNLSTKITFVINDSSVNEFYLNIGNSKELLFYIIFEFGGILDCKLPGEVPGFSGKVKINRYNASYQRVA